MSGKLAFPCRLQFDTMGVVVERIAIKVHRSLSFNLHRIVAMFRPLFTSCLLILLFILASSTSAQDIDYVEQFALAADREQALQQLVPGTEAYYFYHCLHYQNSEQLDKVEQMLTPWVRRHGETQLVQEIRHRQALLNYDQTPDDTLEYLRRHLNLRFDHQRQIPAAQRGLPTRLDQNLISFAALYRRATSQHRNTDGFEMAALEKIASQRLNEIQLRHLLQRLQIPDLPNLPELIHQDLNSRNAPAFGSYTIHQRMTLDQLDQLARLRPRLLLEQPFVNIYLSKLGPDNDVNLQADRDAHRQYLDRLWGFAENLSPAFNSLKANILFRRLDFDRGDGVYDKSRFIRYLELPRQVAYINRQVIDNMKSRGELVNLNADYQPQTGLRPIITDEPLVRDYLHHFLKDLADYKEFLPLVNDGYLKRRFAETKIVNGLGDTEQWASMLSPDEYQQLMKRVDLDFALTNPKFHQTDQSVVLKLTTKNVKNLIVKVFEINTTNYYKQFRREIDTDVNLDGLVPNWQQSYQYDDLPQLRVERTFTFDQIDHPGVFVVDFIGNGKSSRALIRKGRLHHLVETTIAGHRFTILDEHKQPLNDASLWIAGRQYQANDQGLIDVPFSTQPGRESVIIEHGTLSALASFDHLAEQYELRAGMYVDRESLIRGGTAELIIRPQLIVAQAPAPLEILSDVKLMVRATDLDGVASTKEYPDLKLDEATETVVTFQVPARLSQIDFSLIGQIENVSLNEKQTLTTEQAYAVNQIDNSPATYVPHLKRIDDGYRLALRGKTGEARANQSVLLTLKHRLFTRPVQVSLQSDENGQIELGLLSDITGFDVRMNQGQTVSWTLPGDRQTGYRSIHASVGQTIAIPYAVPASNGLKEWALLEVRRRQWVADHTDKVKREEGLLSIQGLAAGDYQLYLKPDNRFVTIRVSEGKTLSGYVLGRHRDLELRGEQPLFIKQIVTDNSSIKVQLGGNTEFARVHALATRYEPRFDAFAQSSRIRDIEPLAVVRGIRPNAFIAGRAIGEEYRYILDRRYAAKFPGNMLTRPSLLLNPWALRTTENTVQVAADGDDFGGVGGVTDSEAGRSEAQQSQAEGISDFANLDFLAKGTVALLNLEPGEDGVVTIDRDQLGDKQLVRIIVQDPTWTLARHVELPERGLKYRDMRLASELALDPDQHFAQRKEYSVLNADEDFELTDIQSARFQHYDDLGDVYRYYVTLTGNAQLGEFSFLMSWPQKTDEEKQQLYTKYACHELNFFLQRKDPEFFDAVVAPYLANKIHKTYLDDYLVNGELARFAQPWEFRRLNTVEQILLGRRVTSHREQLNRHIADAYQLNPTDRRRFDELFEVAVKTSALETEGAYRYFEGDRLKQLRELDEANQDKLARLQAGEAIEESFHSQSGKPGGRAGAGFAANEPRPSTAAAMRQAETRASGRDRARRALGREALDLGDEQSKAAAATERLGRKADEKSADDADVRRGLELEGKKVYKNVEELALLRQQVQQYYRRIQPTQEWVENNYYHLPIEQQTAELVKVNRYWRDLAMHDGSGPFLSPYFAEASNNFTEMMLALGVMDLPFEAPEHEFDYTDNNMNLVPASNLIAFYQQVRPAVFDRRGSTVLVSENFFRNDDRYRVEDGKRYDKFVTKEFLSHVLYGGQVVITNPTSTPQAIDLLIQIPAGAMPAAGSQETRTIQQDLAAFSTQTLEYFFYFPAAGDFSHYPAHVSIDNLVVATADPLRFNVVDEPSEVDTESWAYVSQNGSDGQVIEFLQNNNLQEIDLSQIAFRMKDRDFYQRVISLLASRFAYDDTLWSYSIKHNDPANIEHFLKHANAFLAQCGSYLKSPLITIEPVPRFWYQHREFWPLVNARAHQLGAKRKILNDRIWEQYHALLEILARRQSLDDDDQLAVTYYMLLQDRVEEALKHFAQVNPQELPSRLQYDYCAAYVAMYQEQPERAGSIAETYQQYPVKRWRDLFATVLKHVEEIRTSNVSTTSATAVDEDRSQTERQTDLANQTPTFDFVVEARQARIDYQNLQRIVVNYYEMDVELLFSRNPFVQQRSDGFAMIRPNISQEIELPADQTSHAFDLPEEFKNSNVLVEIIGGGTTKSKAYYANSLAIQLVEQYGQLRVADQETDKPLSKVYIKVYARKADGSAHFYKDGYTDLRGRFDYASLSNQNLDEVERFAILMLSDEHGAVVREASVPKE